MKLTAIRRLMVGDAAIQSARSLKPSELTRQLASSEFRLPEYTKLGSDRTLYPSSQQLGYGVKLEVEPAGRSLVVNATETSGLTAYDFHRVLIDADGSATYHPNSTTSRTLAQAADGTMQLPTRLSSGIAIPQPKNGVIVLATASRKGDLLEVLSRRSSGQLESSAYQLVGSTLQKLSASKVESLRTGNEFRPSGTGASTFSFEDWARTVPAAPRPVVSARPAAPVAPRRPVQAEAPRRPAPAVAKPVVRRRDPDEFFTVQEEREGYGVYRGSRQSGIAVLQRTFASRSAANDFANAGGDRLLFVNADRNSPVL